MLKEAMTWKILKSMTNEDRTQYENSGRHGVHRLLNGGNP